MQTLLQLALQVCFERAAAPHTAQLGASGGAAAAAAAAGAACVSFAPLQDALPLPLQLSTFSAVGTVSPALLRVLAQIGVRQVDMTNAALTAPLCGALASMHSVQELTIFNEMEDTPVQLAAAVANLQQLTSLTLTNLIPSVAVALPASLKHLWLAQDTEPSEAGVVDISHLTALSRLDVQNHVGRTTALPLTIPAQPLDVMTYGLVEVLGSRGIKDMWIVCWAERDMQALLMLPGQPQLRDLALTAKADRWAAHSDTRAQCAAALGQVTGLTRLKLYSAGQPLLHHLSKLHHLLSLYILQSQEQPLADVLQLSTLTNLTCLVLEGGEALGQGLDDVAAVTLASALSSLQRLDLISQGMRSWAVLPAVGRLTKLRSLKLWPNHGAHLTPLLLQQLSFLTGLTSLTLPVEHCSQENQQLLLAKIPGLTAISSTP